METQITRLKNFEIELNIKTNSEEFLNYLDKATKNYCKKISVPGFRKGKVPPHIVKKMFGDALKYELAEDISELIFWDVIDFKKLHITSTPKLTDYKIEDDNSLNISLNLEAALPPDEINYKDLKLKKFEYVITDKNVDNALEYFLTKSATETDAETIDSKFTKVKIEVNELDEEGKLVDPSQAKEETIELFDPNLKKDLFELLINKNLNDEFDYLQKGHHHHHSEDEEEGHLEEEHDHSHNDALFHIKIKEIKKLNVPELTDDYVKELTKDKYQTVQEYREFVKENLERSYEDLSIESFYMELKQQLLEANPFDVPEAYIDRMMEIDIESQKKSGRYQPELFENEYFLKAYKDYNKTEIEKIAKWNLLLNKFYEVLNIEITEEEFINEANKLVDSTGITFEKALKFTKQNSTLIDNLMREKFINYFLENYPVEKEVINLTEEK